MPTAPQPQGFVRVGMSYSDAHSGQRITVNTYIGPPGASADAAYATAREIVDALSLHQQPLEPLAPLKFYRDANDPV